ncbi:MAG: DUF2796 domain-containing protein [Deinococcales bacterium]
MSKIVLSMMLALSLLSYGQEAFVQHDAHTHGEAELNLVIEEDSLWLELLTPALHFLGFEHEAQSDEEKAKVAQVLEALQEGSSLFQFNPQASCEIQALDIHLGHAEHHDEEHHDEEHHDEEHHDDEHHNEEDNEEYAESHRDIFASYQGTCQNIAALTQLDLGPLFNNYPLFEVIHVQWLGPQGQSASELRVNASQLKLD